MLVLVAFSSGSEKLCNELAFVSVSNQTNLTLMGLAVSIFKATPSGGGGGAFFFFRLKDIPSVDDDNDDVDPLKL